jgi:aspartyl-tRNA(Asn)/glutamyl-tRNA(Gln) amidotransferase subunit A
MRKGKPVTYSKSLEGFIAPFDATAITRLKDPAEFYNLHNDVFGHVRTGAAKQGKCYIRPTYGTVSRYGLIPTVCSMDQIGIVCKDPAEGFAVLEQIAGYDEKDGAMFPEKSYSYTKADKAPIISREAPAYYVEQEVQCILMYAETMANLSRYDGIKFGYRTENYKGLEDLYIKTRTEAFGIEEKFATIMGAYVLSQENYERYYLKAMKIRRLIKQSLRFDEYDVLELPVASPLALLCGLPSLTFGDVQLVANVKNENALWAAWEVQNP